MYQKSVIGVLTRPMAGGSRRGESIAWLAAPLVRRR
jgi:hypothetical protein